MKLQNLVERAITKAEAHRALARLANDVLVGFEFEFAVPEKSPLHAGVGDAPSMQVSRIDSLDELFGYFEGRRGTGYTKRRIDSDFDEWVDQQREEWAENNWDRFIEDPADPENEDEDFEDRKSLALHDARNEAERRMNLDFNAYVDAQYGSMYNLIADNNLDPINGWEDDRGNDAATFYTEERGGGEEKTREAVANALGDLLDTQVTTRDSTVYTHWKVVADGSVQGGHSAEIISPPLPWDVAKADLTRIIDFAYDYDLETNASTGLHVNVSVPNIDKMDILKFVLFLGDEFALDVFSRSNSEYAISQTRRITRGLTDAIKNQNLDAALKLPEFEELRSWAALSLSNHKYNSVNISKLAEHGYLEIRIAGGDYRKKIEELETFLDRIVIALDTALSPTEFRQAYAKKLYKLFDRSRWLADTTSYPGRQGSLQSSMSTDRAAQEAYRTIKNSTAMERRDAIMVFSRLIGNLADEVQRRKQSRLGITAAGELLKDLKRFGISVADLLDDGPIGINVDLRKLGLAK